MKDQAVNKINKKIGLVLSGGGARAYAHVGVLQALNEHGIYPAHLSGASARKHTHTHTPSLPPSLSLPPSPSLPPILHSLISTLSFSY